LPIELQAGATRCLVLPDIGGAVAGLWWQDMPVLRCTPLAQLTSPRQGAAFSLLPYSNRIGHGDLRWNDSAYTLQGPLSDAPHTIHGVGWQRPWQVLHQSQDAVDLGLQHPGDPAWPFAFEAVQHLRVHADGLAWSLTLRNDAPHTVPAGIGWHPYFVKRPGAQLRFSATRQWQAQADCLPTTPLPWPRSGEAIACADWQVDHCFDGWQGRVELQDESLQIGLESNLSQLAVFTAPHLPFVALEPVSHVHNALQLVADGRLPAPGMAMLAPGATLQGAARIDVACLR
jgi:aldose 1-epimerase